MTENGEYIDVFAKFRDEKVFNDNNSIKEAFDNFDATKTGFLNLAEFENLLKALFSYNGNSYFISKEKINKMFDYFKSDTSGAIELKNFEKFWFKIIKQTLLPRSALVIVDVQNDFIDGSLSLSNCPAKQDGAEVVPVINNLIESVPFDAVAYTLDWHPEEHCSFFENVHMRKLSDKSPVSQDFKLFDTIIFDAYPDAEQKLWPTHCVQDSHGSQLHPDLIIVNPETDKMNRNVVYTKKGCQPDIDSYSAFFDNCKLNETGLDKDLKSHSITDIYVCGLAADVCVAATAYDGLTLDYRVVYVTDAARGVDVNDIADQKKILVNHGALMVNSKQVTDMVNGKNRRPELGYAAFSAII